MSTIIDACTKELLSWVLSESLEIDFVLETVKQLIEKHGIRRKTLPHTGWWSISKNRLSSSGRADIVRFVKENGIRMINFMYPADDNRLKTLNFVINSEDYLDTILTYGERVDGSSLFPFFPAMPRILSRSLG